jgi:hypothetical protein
MRRVLRVPFITISLLLCAVPACATPDLAFERGTAITEPYALRELDHHRFDLGRLLAPARSADQPLTNDQLFALPSMAPLRKALDEDFKRYIANERAHYPSDAIGVGQSFDIQLFDHALLYSADTRFVLGGIVSRMDRAYVSRANCGEVRLIYRLTRLPDFAGNDRMSFAGNDLSTSARLPMTLNVVLKAKGDHDVDANGATLTCAEIARRWLAAGELSQTGADLASKLTAKNGPLDLIRPENIDRIETNLQIAHMPKSEAHEFRTDYLMKVFDYHAPGTFDEAPMEDQIDRDRLLADANLRAEFRAWLLDPVHLRELDRGTILIPDKFLAKSAITSTPIGFAPSDLQPAHGLVQGYGAPAEPTLQESDVVTALQKAAESNQPLDNIRSVAGFERRLNDVSCTGCHETRGVGGFHFPGVDWMVPKPSNVTVVPASPHFFGDQVRRRDIEIAFRDGKEPDFSHGFASRPQTRGSTELAGTDYQDGWGAHCYAPHANAAEDDKSFASWTCAKGLACQVMSPATRMGMCFIPSARDVKADSSTHD